MSKYNNFMQEINDKDRIHFQEWIGDNIIFNGVVDKSTGKGVGRIFRLEEEIELDTYNDTDGINLIAKRYMDAYINNIEITGIKKELMDVAIKELTKVDIPPYEIDMTGVKIEEWTK